MNDKLEKFLWGFLGGAVASLLLIGLLVFFIWRVWKKNEQKFKIAEKALGGINKLDPEHLRMAEKALKKMDSKDVEQLKKLKEKLEKEGFGGLDKNFLEEAKKNLENKAKDLKEKESPKGNKAEEKKTEKH